jgi:mannosyltransferase OCH1-like enzyme
MIPKIIHQSWKVDKVPARWLAYQQSWRKNHPDYEYKFWTDETNREFVAEVFPKFLQLYDKYRHPVSRADLARYLVVCHYGGVYADLDLESLRPLDDLLVDREFLIALEPYSHLDKEIMASRGFKRIVCNAFFAAVPRHPFWRHLFPFLMDTGNENNALDAAGPFILTRACDAYPGADVTVLPPRVIYPIDHYLQPTRQDTEDAAFGSPYTIHHWAGTWWRESVLINAWRRIIESKAVRTPAPEGR